MKNIAVTIAAIALMFASQAIAQDTDTDSKDYVIMKVGNDQIKKSEVEKVWRGIFPGSNPPKFDSFDEKIKDNVLRGVASEHIIDKEAEKSGIQNSSEVKDRVAEAKKQIVIQEFLKQKAKTLVTDKELQEAYAERTKNPEEEIHARHILVKTKEEANAIEKKLRNGGNFEQIAKEESEDKSSGAAGGDLGWFTADKMVPEFSKAAFALKKGEVSAPVKTDFGWHIIKLEDRRKVTPPTFSEMKDHLAQELGNKAIGDYINSLMKKARVTVYDENGHARELPSAPPAAAEAK